MDYDRTDMGEPACTPKVQCEEFLDDRTAMLIDPDEVIEAWELNYNLGCVMKTICDIANDCDERPLARLILLEHASYRINREIARERRLSE